jgi:hypothetical protein
MALAAAGIASGATLAGAVVTSFIERRRDAARRAHQDQVEETKRQHEAAVRFHDERLTAYVEYMSAVSTLIATSSVFLTQRGGESFTDFAVKQDALRPYTRAFTRVSMLGKPELIPKVVQAHACIERLVSDHAPEAMKRTAEDATKAIAAFETAAKKELGIS